MNHPPQEPKRFEWAWLWMVLVVWAIVFHAFLYFHAFHYLSRLLAR